MQWSFSKGCSRTISSIAYPLFFRISASWRKMAFGSLVTSMLRALIAMRNSLPGSRNVSRFSANILAWSGCAMSQYTESTSETRVRYRLGKRASSKIGTVLILFLDTLLTRSLKDRCANSTQYTLPSRPTMSLTWLTVVPLAAPKYRTFDFSLIGIL